jgi:tRNA uridine 5-carboxymethylaminomethyl modification enzyme
MGRHLEVEAHYAGYVARQRDEIEQRRRHDSTALPDDLDYARVKGLSNEIREKLGRIRPNDIGQAGRISGMTRPRSRSARASEKLKRRIA